MTNSAPCDVKSTIHASVYTFHCGVNYPRTTWKCWMEGSGKEQLLGFNKNAFLRTSSVPSEREQPFLLTSTPYMLSTHRSVALLNITMLLLYHPSLTSTAFSEDSRALKCISPSVSNDRGLYDPTCQDRKSRAAFRSEDTFMSQVLFSFLSHPSWSPRGIWWVFVFPFPFSLTHAFIHLPLKHLFIVPRGRQTWR